AAHRCIGDWTVLTVVERDGHCGRPGVLLVRSRAIQVTDVHRRSKIGNNRLWRVHDKGLRVCYAVKGTAESCKREARKGRGGQFNRRAEVVEPIAGGGTRSDRAASS